MKYITKLMRINMLWRKLLLVLSREFICLLLQKKIAEEHNKMLHENEETSVDKCKTTLEDLCGEMDQKLKVGIYMAPGGYGMYKEDLRDVETKFQSTPGKGIKVRYFNKQTFVENQVRITPQKMVYV